MKTENAMDIRYKLQQTFLHYAQQCQHKRQWEAASAFQFAAGLAIGSISEVVGDPRPSKVETPCDFFIELDDF
jgi:hypothetical protein